MLTLKIRYPRYSPQLDLNKTRIMKWGFAKVMKGIPDSVQSNSEYQIIHAFCSVQYSDQTFKAKFNKIFVRKLDAFVNILYIWMRSEIEHPGSRSYCRSCCSMDPQKQAHASCQPEKKRKKKKGIFRMMSGYLWFSTERLQTEGRENQCCQRPG